MLSITGVIMNQEQFDALGGEGYNRIPLVREVLADLDTPLSTYLKLAKGAYSFLFESVRGGEKWGRYSIIGLSCRQVLKVYGQRVEVSLDGRVVEEAEIEDPLAWVEQFHGRFHAAPAPGFPHMPRFVSRLVGYFGYDTVRYIEKRLSRCPNPDEIGAPDILFMVADEVLVFDNLAGRLYLVVQADPSEAGAYERARERLNELSARLRSVGSVYPSARPARVVAEEDFRSGFTQEGFEAAVEKIKHYITEGDM